ncbi:hypothetical protein, partial [Paraburkholderia hospita]|uniref:hypothetical protein n=1 Tax=Paraburkholderia hospita TaxID=169430 RepID=UPI001A9999A4
MGNIHDVNALYNNTGEGLRRGHTYCRGVAKNRQRGCPSSLKPMTGRAIWYLRWGRAGFQIEAANEAQARDSSIKVETPMKVLVPVKRVV